MPGILDICVLISQSRRVGLDACLVITYSCHGVWGVKYMPICKVKLHATMQPVYTVFTSMIRVVAPNTDPCCRS